MKYHAKQVYYDPLTQEVLPEKKAEELVNGKSSNLFRFDSQHEFNVFKVLERNTSLAISVHHSIEVIPPNEITTFADGKKWRVDFAVKDEQVKGLFYIEAKGILTKDFILTLALLELYHPEIFNRLWLVFPQKIPNNRVIGRLMKTPFQHRIVTLKNFLPRFKQVLIP